MTEPKHFWPLIWDEQEAQVNKMIQEAGERFFGAPWTPRPLPRDPAALGAATRIAEGALKSRTCQCGADPKLSDTDCHTCGLPKEES